MERKQRTYRNLYITLGMWMLYYSRYKRVIDKDVVEINYYFLCFRYRVMYGEETGGYNFKQLLKK